MLSNNNFVVFSPLRGSSGNGQPAAANQFGLVQVKQEPVDSNSHESTQEHSLDLSKKEQRYTDAQRALSHSSSICAFLSVRVQKQCITLRTIIGHHTINYDTFFTTYYIL